MPVTYIDIRFFAHATEDLKKVVEAVQNILPANHLEDITFKMSNLHGHYGNPITLFETRIKKKDLIMAVVENISSKLNELDKETLLREIGLHVEKGSLYIRLDKQAALRGEFKLCAVDPVHVRIRFKNSNLENIIQVCRELGMLP